MSDFKLSGKVFSGVSIAKDAVWTSPEPLKLKEKGFVGFGSIQINQESAGGIGKARIQVIASNDGENFQVPKINGEEIEDIASVHEDGIDLYAFPVIPISNEIKFKITASDANITSIDGDMSGQ